jgi:hypothetical protein
MTRLRCRLPLNHTAFNFYDAALLGDHRAGSISLYRLGTASDEVIESVMSAFGPKQTCTSAAHMSAFGGKADITFCTAYVRL